MLYHGLYYGIIKNAKKAQRVKGKGIYYESHHIVPKCLNGSNASYNLVLLTGREHFVCHYFLYDYNEELY